MNMDIWHLRTKDEVSMIHSVRSWTHFVNIMMVLLPVVCWEAVLSSLDDRMPGLAVLRLVGGPGGQYTCNMRTSVMTLTHEETLTLLAGADIHLPLSPSPRSSISSLPSEIREHLEKENKLKGENKLEIHKGPLM